MPASQSRVAQVVVERYGTTFAEEAGITLRNRPSPLWRLLVLTALLSARIDAGIAVRSARELSRAGWRTPHRMLASNWQERVDALGRGGYRRYDERTASQLAELAEAVHEDWHDDLRRLHHAGDGDPDRLATSIKQFKGIGPTGAAIFLREVQVVWHDLIPYLDSVAADGAERVGLPREADALRGLVDAPEFGSLVAGCVRAARSDAIVDDIADAVRRSVP